MWENEIQVYELQKGDSGLGFSILDYQVCVCASLYTGSTTITREQQSMSCTSLGLESPSWFEILQQHGSSVS